MNTTYRLIWGNSGVRAEFNGVITENDLKAAVSEFHGSSRFDSINYLLIDLTGVDSLNATNLDLLSIGAMDSAAALTKPRVKVALVAIKPSIVDLLLSYEKGIEGSTWLYQSFSEINEAQQWVLT